MLTKISGGSDVANLTTSAVKTDDGKHYIVNGTKSMVFSLNPCSLG